MTGTGELRHEAPRGVERRLVDVVLLAAGPGDVPAVHHQFVEGDEAGDLAGQVDRQRGSCPSRRRAAACRGDLLEQSGDPVAPVVTESAGIGGRRLRAGSRGPCEPPRRTRGATTDVVEQFTERVSRARRHGGELVVADVADKCRRAVGGWSQIDRHDLQTCTPPGTHRASGRVRVASTSMHHPRFHLAIPVDDLDVRRFYGGVLRCPQGREEDTWVDWDLYGHQLVTHLSAGAGDSASNPVDGHDVPVPHFGVLLDVESFHHLAERVRLPGSVRDRPVPPLRGVAWRAVDDVLPRSGRQRPGVQDLRRRQRSVRRGSQDDLGGHRIRVRCWPPRSRSAARAAPFDVRGQLRNHA